MTKDEPTKKPETIIPYWISFGPRKRDEDGNLYPNHIPGRFGCMIVLDYEKPKEQSE